MQAPLWFNSQVSKDTLYLSAWHSKGINMIGDIVHRVGNIIAIQELTNEYRLAIKIFDYFRVRAEVKAFIKTFKKFLHFDFCGPYKYIFWFVHYGFNLKFVYVTNIILKGCFLFLEEDNLAKPNL